MCEVICFNIFKKKKKERKQERPCALYNDHCVFRSNLEDIDTAFISGCLYDQKDKENQLCPIFRLGDIVKLSGFNFETMARVVSQLQV